MTETIKKGDVSKYSSQLSAKIWGHRFTDGQRGPEYTLEFLNVLFGANYTLNATKYSRKKSTHFRKFIFEGIKEGSKRDIAKLDEDKKKNLYDRMEDDNKVEVIREFFRNLEVPLVDGRGKEADRSWFARTLYPLHESLLFSEIRVKGNSIGFERNFFARGGELYYLMISFGAEHDPLLKTAIQTRIRELLNKNRSLEKIVNSIQDALDDEEEGEGIAHLKNVDGSDGLVPMLPVTNHPLFKEFALELNNILKVNVDIYEMFRLLTSMINFHLMRYMYERAKVNEADQITYFFDCLDGKNNQLLKLSSNTFKNNELLIKNKFEEYFKEVYREKIGDKELVSENLEQWKNAPEHTFLSIMGLTKLRSRKQPVIKVLKQCETYEHVMTKLFDTVKEVVSDQLKKHQLGIIRILARDGGIGNYKAGSSYRYTMSDNFIQSLVFTNVEPKGSIEFNDFLDKLFTSYGFVIGVKQAKDSGLYEESKLNISYFQKNENALRDKLRKNGLLVEYSDATAMIRNPYDIATI
jgi:hypothetical protein